MYIPYTCISYFIFCYICDVHNNKLKTITTTTSTTTPLVGDGMEVTYERLRKIK